MKWQFQTSQTESKTHVLWLKFTLTPVVKFRLWVIRCFLFEKNHYEMGTSESKGENSPNLNVFNQEERQNIHHVYNSIIGNQKTLTEPFLQVTVTLIFRLVCSHFNSSPYRDTRDNYHWDEVQNI